MMVGPKRRRLDDQAMVVQAEPEMSEPELPSTSSSSALVRTPEQVVNPRLLEWNPIVNIEVDKNTRNVSRYLTDFHESSAVVFENSKEVDAFLKKCKDKVEANQQVSIPIIFSRDGHDYSGEAGTMIYPILKLYGNQISCLVLDGNLYTLDERYQLRAILAQVPNLLFLSIKSQGDEGDQRGSAEFPILRNLKGIEIATHFYCGLAKKLLEAYGSQITKLRLQDLDSRKYSIPPGGFDSLNRMVKGLIGNNGMLSEVKELNICSLRNLGVLSSLARLNAPSWSLKRLAVNVTMPNEYFKFSHFQMILNRFARVLEEVHLDCFAFHKFVEAFYEWEGARGDDYPTEVLPRQICEKVKILSLPALVLMRYELLGEILGKYFPRLEILQFLRWDRKWPMKVHEYLGRPQKRDLGKIFKKMKKVMGKLREVKVVKGVDMEKEEEKVYFKRFEETKKLKDLLPKKRGEGGGKSKREIRYCSD